MTDALGALAVLLCTFGGTLLGMRLARTLPAHHLAADSKDSVKLGMGFTASITALVLGLVTAAAKSDFDDYSAALRRGAADVLILDRTLARYESETAEVRAALHANLAARIAAIWPEEAAGPAAASGQADLAVALETIADRIGALAPDTDARRRLQSEAADTCRDIIQTRWRVLERGGSSVPVPFVVILVLWLALIFTSFGLLAPRNATTLVVLFACASSAAGAMFLILEMSAPLDGTVKVSSAPMRYALEHLGR